jgi:hypothetical protein
VSRPSDDDQIRMMRVIGEGLRLVVNLAPARRDRGCDVRLLDDGDALAPTDLGETRACLPALFLDAGVELSQCGRDSGADRPSL